MEGTWVLIILLPGITSSMVDVPGIQVWGTPQIAIRSRSFCDTYGVASLMPQVSPPDGRFIVSGSSKSHDQIRRVTEKEANQESPHHKFGSLKAFGNSEEFGDDIDNRPCGQG